MNEKYVSINGTKIRYLEAGNSEKTLVLLHGLGGSAERWMLVIPSLAKSYHVIVPDLIGYGKSDKPKVEYSMEFFTKFIFDLLDELKIKHCSMIGSSLGGQIVAECACTDNDFIKKIILVSPSGSMKSSTPVLDAYASAVLNPSFESVKSALSMMVGSDIKIPNEIIEDFISNMSQQDSKMSFKSTLTSIKNSSITEKLSRIRVPSLVIWGKNDKMIPVENASELEKTIRNCHVKIMEGCGHVPYEEKPEEFSKLVLDFLK